MSALAIEPHEPGDALPREVREAFRNFRVDRIQELGVFEERFRDEPGKTLADMFRTIDGDHANL